MTLEILSFLPLVDLEISDFTKELLSGSNQMNRLPHYVETSCNNAQSRGFKCSSFLYNAQKEILVLLTALIVFVAALILKNSRHGQTCLGVVAKVAWMFSTEVSVKAFYLFSHFNYNSVADVFDVITAAVSVVLCLGLLGGILKYPALFSNIGCSSSKTCRWHVVLFTVHRLSFSSLIALFDAPLVQIVLISSVTLAVSAMQLLVFHIAVRPYESKTAQLNEILMLSWTSFIMITLITNQTEVSAAATTDQLVHISLIGIAATSVLIMQLGVLLQVLSIYRSSGAEVADL
jgi:hypothetical protein